MRTRGGASPHAVLWGVLFSALLVLGTWTIAPSVSALPGNGSIAGTVTNTSAAPLANITVTAHNAYYGNVVATTSTSGTGTYAITGVAATNYILKFSDPSTTYATLYHPGVAVFNHATPVSVSAGGVTTASIAMARPGSIRGMVSNALRIPNIYVLAGTADPNKPVEVVGSGVTDSQGVYTIPNLPAGDYKLLFVDPVWLADSTRGYRPKFYTDPVFLLGSVGIDAANLANFNANLAAASPQRVTAGSVRGVVGTRLLGADCDPAFFTRGKDLTGINLAGKQLQACDLTDDVLTGADLSGADLRGAFADRANLNDADLRDAYLHLVWLPQATLRNADLTGANLTIASFDGADLTNASLRGTTLDRTNVRNATVEGTDFQGATISLMTTGNMTGTPINYPTEWSILRGYFVGPNTNLGGASLNLADLRNIDFTNAVLTNATLWFAKLAGANLAGANLTNVTLNGVTSGGITGTPLALPAGWSLRSGFLVGPAANLIDADLHGIDLSNTNLTAANLTGANLAGANLTNANLTNATLTGTTLTGATMAGATLTGITSGGVIGAPGTLPATWVAANGFLVGPGANLPAATLAGANLTGASLQGANLAAATLTGTNLTGASLQGANLSGAALSGAILTRVSSGQLVGVPASLPTGSAIFRGYLLGPGVDLTGASLPQLDLNGIDLSGAILVGVSTQSTTGTAVALPAGVVVRNGYLVGGATRLDDANLGGADLAGLDLSGSSMKNVRSGGITGAPLGLPIDFVLRNGYLVGPWAWLDGASLGGANLTGANLSNARLDGASLGSANLAGANLSSARLDYATMSFTNLTNANLTFANLSGTKLGYATLNGANFTSANVQSANLGLTKLTATNFTNAVFNGVSLIGATGTPIYAAGSFVNTTCPDGTNSSAHGNTCQGHPWP